MKLRNLLISVFVIGSASLLLWTPASSAPPVNGLVGKMLMGTIRSDGKPMEGVVVSARSSERTFTTSVYTDDRGNFVFPALEPGQYKVWAQAAGYEAGRAELKLDANKETRQDFTLKTIGDFSSQMSGAEYVAALPSETFEDKRMREILQNHCAACHPPSFILQNRFDKAGWLAAITPMEKAATGEVMSNLKNPLPSVVHFKDELATYLARVRGPGPSPLKFKPLPRTTGDATRAVITEYDIPPGETPDQLSVLNGSDWSEGTPARWQNQGTHDATVDFYGNGWVTQNGSNLYRSFEKIDSKTGKITVFKVPGRNGGFRQTHEITTAPDGMIWMNLGGALGKVDPQTDKLDIFEVPAGMGRVGNFVDVNAKGKIGIVNNNGGLHFDPFTKEFTEFKSPSIKNPKFGTYGGTIDMDGNVWWADLTEDKLEVADLKTGKIREVQFTPRPELRELTTEEDRAYYSRMDNLKPLSNNMANVGLRTPRRMSADPFGPTVWVTDYFGQDIASVDIHTMQVTYHDLPMKYASAYDLHVDNNHMVWVALRNADRVGKYDPKTNKWTVYQLPSIGTECRSMYVDEYDKTGEVWLASIRGSKAIRMQFRTDQQMAEARRAVAARGN
jgi:streptogramin lyase